MRHTPKIGGFFGMWLLAAFLFLTGRERRLNRMFFEGPPHDQFQ